MWVSLSKIRRRCLWPWILITAVIAAIILAQTLSGKLGAAVCVVWIWFGLCMLPGLALLLLSVLLHRTPDKMLPSGLQYAILGISLLYLFLALATLLGATFSELSLIDYFQQSYYWLIPLKIILLTGYWLVFWRKTSVFQPNAQIITGIVANKAKQANDRGDVLRSTIYAGIAAGHINEALETLRTHFLDNDRRNSDLVMLQGEYTTLKRNVDLNLIEPAEAQRQLNRITMAILNILE